MQPITRPSSLKQSVIDSIKTSIITGELELGQQLSERALADKLNVSKTPVREALAHLRLEGLVEVYPQRGAYVFTPNSTEVIAMCELRQTLEASALRLAIERNPVETERDLGLVVKRMEVARKKDDRRAYLTEDSLFHLVLFTHCGNNLMLQTYEMLVGKICALRTHLAQRPGHTDLSFAEHMNILAAVKRRDSKTALSTLDTHIDRTRLSYTTEVARISAINTHDETPAKGGGRRATATKRTQSSDH